jgi:hypothetical protein
MKQALKVILEKLLREFFFYFGVEESIVNEPLVFKTLIFQTAE